MNPYIGPVSFSIVNREKRFSKCQVIQSHEICSDTLRSAAFVGGDQDANNEHSAAQCVNSIPRLLSSPFNSFYLDL